MSEDIDAADRLNSSWDDNARAWTTTVRESRIESRRVATDRAIMDAVLQRKPVRVLDVGCGEGWLCRALRQHSVICTGVDGSSDLIRAARAADPEGAYHLLRYEDSDRLTAVVEAASIDVAVCNFALLHEDLRLILSAVRAALRPGGALLIQTVHPWTASESCDYADGWRTENFAWSECCFPRAMPWYFRTLESWVRTIREAGFVLDHVTEPAHPQNKTPLSLLLSAVKPGQAMPGSLYRLTAFTTTPEGGNPAGIWIGDQLPAPTEMLRIAKDVGFSETAFLAPANGNRRLVRYYSPEAEVPFCGHATIAAGVKLGELDGEGEYHFETAAGDVAVAVRKTGQLSEAALTSVTPRHVPAPQDILAQVLGTLSWGETDLDPAIPPALAFAGAWHFIIAAATATRLEQLNYDFDALKQVMLAADLTTVHLVWRERSDLFHARDPFPVGGVVEDPATGAAAAAFGGYLRDAKLIDIPAKITILQGETMGRPSRLNVHIPLVGGIVVSGHAVDLDVPEDQRPAVSPIVPSG